MKKYEDISKASKDELQGILRSLELEKNDLYKRFRDCLYQIEQVKFWLTKQNGHFHGKSSG